MSWKRGNQQTDFELSRCQEWIEEHDIVLNGEGGEDKGLIREFREDKVAAKQRSADVLSLIKFVGWVLGLIGGGNLALGILHAIRVLN